MLGLGHLMRVDGEGGGDGETYADLQGLTQEDSIVLAYEKLQWARRMRF